MRPSCLFGTFGYSIEDDEVVSCLRRIREHLEPNGLFVFDFWPVHAYVRSRDWQSVREIEKGGTYIIRIMKGNFELESNIVNITIKCNVIRDQKLFESFQEEHRIRTFTLPEISHILKENGFKPLGFFKVNCQAEHPYSLDPVDIQTTNVACVAQKI